MLCVIDYAAIIYPSVMIFIGLASLLLNWWVSKRSNERFKREQMDKKADVTYVDDKVDALDKEVSLKLELHSATSEEIKSTLEHMSEQINFIYQTHYKK